MISLPSTHHQNKMISFTFLLSIFTNDESISSMFFRKGFTQNLYTPRMKTKNTLHSSINIIKHHRSEQISNDSERSVKHQSCIAGYFESFLLGKYLYLKLGPKPNLDLNLSKWYKIKQSQSYVLIFCSFSFSEILHEVGCQ